MKRGPNTTIRQLLLLYILFILLPGISKAQSTIMGSVQDHEGKPLTNASILLLNTSDSSLVKGDMTTKNGTYSFKNIGAGSYMVSSTYIGFRQIYSSPFMIDGQKNLTVPSLKFIESETELSAVVVTAKKPLVELKIDRMVINVEGSITAAGSTALEVLSRSPGVIVDRQNNSISMNGKDGVVVMINGRISRVPVSSLVQMLSGMSSSNIEKIELITTPPANFDAEGNAGYINIVLKTNTQFGTNGSYTLTAGYGKGLITASSINFNHRSGNVNFYGDFSFSRNVSKQTFYFYKKVSNNGTILESSSNSDRTPVVTNYDGQLGLDIELSKKTILGGLVSAFNNRWKMEAANTGNIFVDNRLDTVTKISNDESHILGNYGINLNLQHNINVNDKLVTNLDYVSYKDNNPVSYLNSYFDGNGNFQFDEQVRSSKYTPIQFLTGSADYTKKISEKVSMETGIKQTISHFTNDVSVERMDQSSWVKDPALTAKYKLKESISAAYTSFNFAMGKGTNGKLGFRYEYTVSNLGSETEKNIVDRKYGRLFPTLFISHSINDNNSYNFSYSRRITRPTFNDMAPFVIFMDPSTFFSGNPALQPSIADGVKFDYVLKKYIFSVSYTYEADPITNFAPRVDSVTNKQTFAAENQKNQQVVSLVLSIPVTVTHWWNMQNNFTGTWNNLSAVYLGSPLRIKQSGFNLYSIQSFTLPGNFSAELSGYYVSGGLFGVYKIKPVGSADIGLQKKFSENGGTLRFNVSNFFGAPKFKASVNEPDKNLIVNAALTFNVTAFRLTYTKNFGNAKVKANRNRSTGAEDEMNRVNKNQ